ncbi:MAG: metallophosphoesterase family protein [Methanobacteriota archaeon]
MRIAAVGDVHGHEHLPAFLRDLDALPPVDLFLLAGDTTDRNDIEAFGKVVGAIRDRLDAPIWAVFGNNEYAHDHATYRDRFSERLGVRFLEDEAATFDGPPGERVRIVGSTGSLDRPTWWQRKNLPHVAGEYERRIATLDRLLGGDGARVLLTHYPPTYATMGGEKEAWRPELGCRALEPVVLRRRPTLVVHGHIHKGIPYAEVGERRGGLDAYQGAARVPVHNVAYPVRRAISVLDL